MEKASGMDLNAFFEGWIYGSAVPSLGFTSTLTPAEARIRLEHLGAVIPTPVTVSIVYPDGSVEETVVVVNEKVVERTLPLKGPVRAIEANRDYGAVAVIR